MEQEIGKIAIIDKRPMRVKVYELIDELNVLDNKVWKRLHSKEVRGQFKKIRRLLNAL